MLLVSSQDLAIEMARQNGTLRVTEEVGRFGPYWAIQDEHGLIEVALTKQEALDRLAGRTTPAERLA